MVQEKAGEGVEATENGKLVEKPEENGMGGGSTNIKLEEYIENSRKKMIKIYQIFFISFH